MSSINPSSASLSAQVSLAVAQKTQDVAKAQGEAAVAMLQQAAQLQQQLSASSDPHRGHRLDVLG